MKKIFALKDSPILISEFTYDLNESLIANHPASPRDSSRLLFYNRGMIEDKLFKDFPNLLPSNSALFFNNTKVIKARLFFNKPSGAKVEILLLEPVVPAETNQIMNSRNNCVWQCMIGNLKKWKGEPLELIINDSSTQNSKLSIKLINREKQIVEFTWNLHQTFAEILSGIGNIPLPPYLKREPTENDQLDYQTIYSSVAGAVAAPTAGLHFTKNIFRKLEAKNIETNYLTLHVSAGTFKPVEVEIIKEHPIHQEEIIIKKETVKSLMREKKVIAIGTTSLRVLESIYWFGVQLGIPGGFVNVIRKETPYQINPVPHPESLQNVLEHMRKSQQDIISIKTELFIYPGYKFQICHGLVTNFHLPKSTLITLVAAFIGNDWRKVYRHAIENNYRFLSYGDSSMLIPGDE